MTRRSVDNGTSRAAVTVPYRWRLRDPGVKSVRTLYQFVREHLCSHGGECSRSELMTALMDDSAISARLTTSQGFQRLLWNMHYSGWIEAPGHRIRATPKTLRRTAIPPR